MKLTPIPAAYCGNRIRTVAVSIASAHIIPAQGNQHPVYHHNGQVRRGGACGVKRVVVDHVRSASANFAEVFEVGIHGRIVQPIVVCAFAAADMVEHIVTNLLVNKVFVPIIIKRPQSGGFGAPAANVHALIGIEPIEVLNNPLFLLSGKIAADDDAPETAFVDIIGAQAAVIFFWPGDEANGSIVANGLVQRSLCGGHIRNVHTCAYAAGRNFLLKADRWFAR